MSMRDHVERFVAHKRSLGCKYEREERRLLMWAVYAIARDETIIRADSMVRWARITSSSIVTRHRLALGSRFARWLRADVGSVRRIPFLRMSAMRFPIRNVLADAEISVVSPSCSVMIRFGC